MRKALFVVGFVAACDSAYMPPQAPPAKGFQLVTPVIEVPAGKEQLWCSFFKPLDKDAIVEKIEAFQAPGGHHAVLVITTQPYQDGVVQCDGDVGSISMTGWRYVGGGDAKIPDGTPLPPGKVLKIPAGKTLMIQSHYVGGRDGIRAHDAINVHTIDSDTDRTYADYWSFGDTGIKVPKGTSQVQHDCDIENDVKITMLFGHTHQFGTLFEFELLRGGKEDAKELLYHETDGVLMKADPPKKRFSDDAPLLLNKGDKVRFRCGWESPNEKEMKFPQEMCQGMMLYYPSLGGFMVCDKGGRSELVK